jgi:2OG-Fe(II) oxygenase superfamily
MFRCFDPSVASALLHDGFAVVDNALVGGAETTSKLRSEIEKLPLVPNETHFVSPGSTLRLSKSHIRESELHLAPAATRSNVPNLVALEQDSSLAAMLSVYIPELTLRRQALKAQHNAGHGGCFPIHLDSDPSVDNRVVTAILYLNENWKRDHGGELRLYPYPSVTQTDVEPMDGRLVLLSATERHHRVMPSTTSRYAVTLWLSGSTSAKIPTPQRLEANCRDLHRILLLPRYRKHFVRIALSDEWLTSLLAAHPPEQGDAIAEAHQTEVQKLCAALSEETTQRFRSLPKGEVEALLAGDRLVLRQLLESLIADSPSHGLVAKWL